VDATRTVFIDDQEINLVTARQRGMRTILFGSTPQCERELIGLGVALS
jgi:FMN phosphatase YigB (HAD superfamily)